MKIPGVSAFSFVFTLVLLVDTAVRMRSRGVQPNTDFIIGVAAMCCFVMTYISMFSFRGVVQSGMSKLRRSFASPVFTLMNLLSPSFCVLLHVSYFLRLFFVLFNPSSDYFNITQGKVVCMQLLSLVNAFTAFKYAEFVWMKREQVQRLRGKTK